MLERARLRVASLNMVIAGRLGGRSQMKRLALAAGVIAGCLPGVIVVLNSGHGRAANSPAVLVAGGSAKASACCELERDCG
jgi:hypothetical protein